MNPFLRLLAFLMCSSTMSVLALQWTEEPVLLAGTPPPGTTSAASASPYLLSDLPLLRETMKYVRESYVDPTRVDPERMYTAALEAVEALVPAVMFRKTNNI